MKHRDLRSAQPLRDRLQTFALEIERRNRGAIQQRAKQTGDRAAEARVLHQTQGVPRREPEAVGVTQDIMQDVTMRVRDALGRAGGARGIEDARDIIGRDRPIEVFGRASIVGSVGTEVSADDRKAACGEVAASGS